MPTLSTEYYSVDTIQVHGADQAFLTGSLGLDPVQTDELAATIPVWGDSLINCCLVSGVIIFFIITLSHLVELLPMLFGGIWRTKPIMNIENNVRLGRQRNLVAGGAFAAMCLFLSRYDIFSLRILERFSSGVTTLLIAAMILVILLFRYLLIQWLEPRRRGREYYKASNTLLSNFVILATLFMGATIVVCQLFGANEMIVRRILISELGLSGVVFALRKIEISSNFCNLFVGFLYLCALEIFPASLLVAASILF